jgi:pyrimidine-specific ribonucleoside hydrolase
MRKSLIYIFILLFFSVCAFGKEKSDTNKIPVVVITDCYHPYQDPGDNLDLISGFALDNIDLKGIILDITDSFRKDTADHPYLWKDPRGPREAGIIPVMQLNYIFNRNVPFAIGPMELMRSETDKMEGLPSFQENGVNLLISILKESKRPIDVLSFGSARVIAVAYNREPNLLKKKIRKIHLSAGTASENFQQGKDYGANSIPGGEWNVALDVFAFIRLMKSDLPIAIYPCAGKDGGFVKDVNNTYWLINDMSFLKEVDLKLQRYLLYAFNKKLQNDFLRTMDNGQTFSNYNTSIIEPFHFWESAIWLQVSQRKIVKTSDGGYAILKKAQISDKDSVIIENLLPCKIEIRQDGRFRFDYTTKPSNFSIYHRSDVDLYEKAMQIAYPKLLKSYHP